MATMATMSTKVGICDIGAKQHRAGLYQDDLLRCPRQTIWRVSKRREPEQEQACLPKPWSRSLRPVCGFLVTHWASVSTCAWSKKRRVWRRRQPFELSSCLPIWWGGDLQKLRSVSWPTVVFPFPMVWMFSRFVVLKLNCCWGDVKSEIPFRKWAILRGEDMTSSLKSGLVDLSPSHYVFFSSMCEDRCCWVLMSSCGGREGGDTARCQQTQMLGVR